MVWGRHRLPGLRGTPGASERVPGAPGMRRPDGTPSDDREGEGSEGGMLSYELVHRHLERAVRAAWGHLARARCAGQGLGHPVYQRAPESWTGATGLRPLYRQFVGSKFVCFDVVDEFRGVKNGWHGDTPCFRMLPIRYGGCLLRSSQYGGTDAASGEGQSSIWCLLISAQKYPSFWSKRKTNYFHKDEKKE